MSEEKKTESSSEEQPQPQQPAPEKEDNKFLRLFFVGLYLCFVTGMGMTLSIYYLFLWDSRMPELPKLNKRH